jgi:hypothetical protein
MPKLQKVEDKKTVCRYCGHEHEYETSKYDYPYWWVSVLINLPILYACLLFLSTFHLLMTGGFGQREFLF